MYLHQLSTFSFLCISVVVARDAIEEIFIHPYQNYSTGDTQYQQWIKLASEIRCSALCSRNYDCRSFSFNRESKICTLCSRILLENGKKVYVKKSRLETPEDKGYLKVSTTFGTVMYRVNVEAKPWLDARDICTSDGGHLLFLHRMEKQTWMVNMIQTSHPAIISFYCDGNDLDDDGAYTNYKDEVLIWTQWGPDEPSRTDGTEHCLMFRFLDEKWNDIDCDIPKPFICEIDI